MKKFILLTLTVLVLAACDTIPVTPETTENTDTVNSTASSETQYSNENHKLSFSFPDNWVVESEEEKEFGNNSTQLRLHLENTEDANLDIYVNTPLIETGYQNFPEMQDGINKPIEGLSLITSFFRSNTETGDFMAHDTYYADPEDFFTSIEFLYIETGGNNFDKYLTDYHSILESVSFEK